MPRMANGRRLRLGGSSGTGATTAGPVASFDPELMELAADVAFTRGKAALKELLDMASVLETPAYLHLLAERPGYREFIARKWDDLSEIMWGTMAVAMARQSDDLAALAAAVHVPTLIIVGEQDEPFRGASDAMAAAIDGAQLVVVPDAGHSPQLENPDAWIDALSHFLASVPAPTA